MTRTLTAWLSVLVLTVSSVSAWEHRTPADVRPHVLFIAIDDLRTSLGCYGDRLVHSQHIDALAQESRLFQRAYTPQAVCGPSRTALFTGLLPNHTRVWHNRSHFRQMLPNAVTLPQLFKNSGYNTVSLGKILSGDERELDPPSWSTAEILRQGNWKNYLISENRGSKKQAAFENIDVPDNAYPDGQLADLAVETVRGLARQQQPFFLAVGFFKPHLPFNAPRRYWDLYDPQELGLNQAEASVEQSPGIALHTHRELGGYSGIPEDERVSPEQSRLLRQGYYACVSYVDAQVGKVLAALKELELDERTIVVLWGDHGFALGEQGRWCKGTNFELDTRVPLLIRTPGLVQPGVSTEALVEGVDLYPTLAELAGLPPPVGLDGVSLVPVLEDPHAAVRECALSQFNRPWKATEPEVIGYSIRTSQHRYTRWTERPTQITLAEELYDYAQPASVQDSGSLLIERRNVVTEALQAGTLEKLRLLLDRTLRDRVIDR